MKLATAQQMRSLDEMAINTFGIPGIILMENAGRATVAEMAERYGPLTGRKIGLFVGPGNNGGDGLVIARHLHQQGALPQVYLLAEEAGMKGDAATNLAIVDKLPIPLFVIRDEESLRDCKTRCAGCSLTVDAILGTGLTRQVTGLFLDAIQLINKLGYPVIAVDVPSGLDSDTGQPLGVAVRAETTVTFGLAKPGLVTYPGAQYAGRLVVADISIPPEAVDRAGITTRLLVKEKMSRLLPARTPAAHKGAFGHLLIVAGATGKTGAALLAAKGALRVGTGLVTLAIPENLNPIFETALWEAMTVPLPHSRQGYLESGDYDAIMHAAEGKTALVVGPGIGTHPATQELVMRLYNNCALPMVVDADGLNILALQAGNIATNLPAARILTPHPGEMARLAEMPTAELQKNRLPTAKRFALEKGAHVVLKGAGTIIAAPDGTTAINSTGNPGMASGGMGDVLTGIIGGLLGQKLSPWDAACLGVFSHGLAADAIAIKSRTQGGFLASEVADAIPSVFAELADWNL